MAQNDTATIVTEPQNRVKSHAAMVWAVIIAFSALFVPTFSYFWTEWNRSHSPFGYGYLVPPTILYLLWCKRKRIKERQAEGGHWSSLIALALGFLLVYVGIKTSINIILNAAFFILLMAIPYYIWGSKVYKTIWGPLAFTATMIPWPDQITSVFLVPAQVLSAKSANWMLHVLGQGSSLEGTRVSLSNYEFEVAKACSGLTIIFPVVAIAILNMMMVDTRLRTKALIVLLSVPISLISNVLRIGIIGLIGNNGGTQLADKLHDSSGIAGVIIAIVLLTLLQWAFKAMTFYDDYMPAFAKYDHAEEPANENPEEVKP